MSFKKLRNYPYIKPPKTYKARMNTLRELLEGNESYPPSEVLWQQMLDIIKEQAKPQELSTIQERILREREQYKPPLPEPLLARVYHQGIYYYLDPRGNLYQGDPGNALVGNLVGRIEQIEDENGDMVTRVMVKNKDLLDIPTKKVDKCEMYQRTYYKDDQNRMYRGLHPQQPYVYLVGKLNSEKKIELA